MNKTVAVVAVLALCLAVVSAKKHFGGPKAHELTASYTFEQYQRDFRKQYRSVAEHDRRAKNFARSLKEAVEHNAKPGMMYKKGVNKFSDWDDIELARLRGGRHDPTMKTKSASGFVSSGLKALPASLDYRQHFPPVLTAVKDQGQCGDCWAHSVTEAIESSYAIATGQLFTLSQQQVTACTPMYGSCYSCDGNYPVLAYEYAVENGITEEWIYPFASYNGTNVNCSATPYTETAVNTIVNISGYTMVGNNSQEDFVSALNELGPLSILVDASSWSSYESGIFNGCDYSQNISLDHAVQVVGYGAENGTEYWIVRNSWAPSWGELGFIRLLKTRVAECGWNVGAAYPSDCVGSGPSATWACGECGILFSPTFPTASPASSSSAQASSGSIPSSGSGSIPSSGSGSIPSSGSGSIPSSGSGSIPSSGSGSIPSSGSGSIPNSGSASA